VSGDRGIGVLVQGTRVLLVLGDVDVRVNADGARALATLLLTGADLADAGEDEPGDDEDDEPTAPGRGLA
jgi:hypothetical protein